MGTSQRTFTALGLVIIAVLTVAGVGRFLTRFPDDARTPATPPVYSIRTGGPPAPSAEMESGMTEIRAQAEPPRRVRSATLPRPRPEAPSQPPVPPNVPPAPRGAPGLQAKDAAPPSGPVGHQSAQSSQAAAPTGPAASGADAPSSGPARDPAAVPPPGEPAPAPAAVPVNPTAPPPAAPKPVPVLTPPVAVSLDPPRHPDAWRVVVEAPGLAAEVRPEGLAARVRLRLHVRDDGAVERVEVAVSSGRPELDAAAAGAARAWRFLPARRDGVAIASTVLIWVAFVVGP